MIYFTSDLHFMHKNIIKYNRPYYNDVTQMNEHIIETINSTVEPWDTLYILGDIAMGSSSKAIALISRIACDVKLVPGNHDGTSFLHKCLGLDNVEVLPRLTNIKTEDTNIVLCHFPLAIWDRSHHGAWHLFGHTHGSYVGHGKSLDVGWDNYYNLYGTCGIFSLEQLKQIMEQKQVHKLSHHEGGNNDY